MASCLLLALCVLSLAASAEAMWIELLEDMHTANEAMEAGRGPEEHEKAGGADYDWASDNDSGHPHEYHPVGIAPPIYVPDPPDSWATTHCPDCATGAHWVPYENGSRKWVAGNKEVWNRAYCVKCKTYYSGADWPGTSAMQMGFVRKCGEHFDCSRNTPHTHRRASNTIGDDAAACCEAPKPDHAPSPYSWAKTAKAALSGYNDVTKNGTPLDECKDACVARPSCKSIDYRRDIQQCLLSDHAAGQQGLVLKHTYEGDPYDYYALIRAGSPMPTPPRVVNGGSWTVSDD